METRHKVCRRTWTANAPTASALSGLRNLHLILRSAWGWVETAAALPTESECVYISVVCVCVCECVCECVCVCETAAVCGLGTTVPLWRVTRREQGYGRRRRTSGCTLSAGRQRRSATETRSVSPRLCTQSCVYNGMNVVGLFSLQVLSSSPHRGSATRPGPGRPPKSEAHTISVCMYMSV